MAIIDFRIRPPVGGFLDMLMYSDAPRRDRLTARFGMTPPPSARQRSLDMLFAEMDAAGIARGVVMGRQSEVFGSVDNREVADLVKTHPARFIGMASIDPKDRRRAVADIDAAQEMGLRGVNIEPGSYETPLYPDDRRLYPIYAHCEDRSLPVVIMAGGNAGPDLSYSFPAHLDRVAADFPRMKIAVSHGGWPWVTEILHIAFRRENLYVAPDNYLCNMPGADDYIRAAGGFLSERFLYASNYPFISVKDYAEWFRGLPIPESAMDRLLYGNALEFLGIEI